MTSPAKKKDQPEETIKADKPEETIKADKPDPRDPSVIAANTPKPEPVVTSEFRVVTY